MLNRRTFNQKNLTLAKLVQFGIASMIGAGIVAGGTYLFTEMLGLYYLISTALAGIIAFGIKFLVNALWTFKD